MGGGLRFSLFLIGFVCVDIYSLDYYYFGVLFG